MIKNSTIINVRDTIKAARVIKTARITGLSERHVRRVLESRNGNQKVTEVFKTIVEEEDKMERALLQKIKGWH